MEEAGQCRLLAGPAAFLAQLLLAVLAFGSLVYKRHVERPQRPVNIWALDVSKQAVSMFAAHACGMIIAIIAHHTASGASSECAWYFVAYTFDTTLGLAFTIGLHKAALHLASWYGERFGAAACNTWATGSAAGCSDGAAADGTEEDGMGMPGVPVASASRAAGRDPWYEAMLLCGNYGNPPSYRRWGLQLSEWVACVVLARAMCGTLVVLLGEHVLVHVAQGLDSGFAGHPTALLFFVMICCPLLMNMCQVLIQDLVLKWRRGGSGSGSAGGSTGKLESLVSMPRRGSQNVLLDSKAERSALI